MTVNKDNAVHTAPAATAKPKEGSGSSMWQNFQRFLREVQIELKKTNWPTRNELTKFTIVVMVTIVAVSAYLFVSDLIVANLFKLAFERASGG